MFDIGWTELLVIGIVALIVVGPKDLPVMFRKLGQFTAKARGMAREFQRAMEQAADETGVKDVSRDLRDMTSSKKLGLDKLKHATRDLASADPKRAQAKKGPATQKLAEEREEKAARLREVSAKATSSDAGEPPAKPAAAPDGAPQPSRHEDAKTDV